MVVIIFIQELLLRVLVVVVVLPVVHIVERVAMLPTAVMFMERMAG